MKDDKKRSLFEQALKKVGPLSHDTVYGFLPALALGGDMTVDRLQKLDAHVHLDILSGLVEREIFADVAQAMKG